MSNLYEHTVIFKQELPKLKVDELVSKYSEMIKQNNGKIIKTEDLGIMNSSHTIEKNRKGRYFHFKFPIVRLNLFQ